MLPSREIELTETTLAIHMALTHGMVTEAELWKVLANVITNFTVGKTDDHILYRLSHLTAMVRKPPLGRVA